MTKEEYQDKLIHTLVFTVIEILQGFYVNHERNIITGSSWGASVDEDKKMQVELLDRMSDLIVYRTLSKTGDANMEARHIVDLKNAAKADLIRKTKELMQIEEEDDTYS